MVQAAGICGETNWDKLYDINIVSLFCCIKSFNLLSRTYKPNLLLLEEEKALLGPVLNFHEICSEQSFSEIIKSNKCASFVHFLLSCNAIFAKRFFLDI